MQASLIITILGTDSPGLVSSISEVLESHQANWSESRMAHLAGKFAGILSVSIAEDKVDDLSHALSQLQKNNLKFQVEKAEPSSKLIPNKTLSVNILCQDRIGIINDVTEVLANLGVNIEELESTVKEASMSGGMLFSAVLTLGLPENIKPEAVEDCLAQLSDQLMIDINFS